MPKKKPDTVVPIRARAKNSDQKRWKRHSVRIKATSFASWIRDTLNRAVDDYEAENDQH